MTSIFRLAIFIVFVSNCYFSDSCVPLSWRLRKNDSKILAFTEVKNSRISIRHDKNIQSTVTFTSPLLDGGYPPTVREYKDGTIRNKPLLLYLPGFDGTLLAPFLQFPELGTEYDVWGMSVSMKDRSTIKTLCDHVIKFITEKLKDNNNKSFYLMGESFGGILTLEVTLAIKNYNDNLTRNNKDKDEIPLDGIVLINPATCYNQSDLAKVGPSVANGSPLLYPLKIMTMIPLFTDDYALPQLMKILNAEGLPSVIDTAEREAYMGRMAFTLPSTLKFMPQGTLKWRLEEWLTKGCASIESKEESIREKLRQLPVLIVAGEKDKTLPSVKESYRLQEILDDVDIHIVKGAGHACTCGSRVDLTALMRKKFLPNSSLGRKEMKFEALSATDEVFFGLEPRYDGANFGLSPLEYWSKSLYQKIII